MVITSPSAVSCQCYRLKMKLFWDEAKSVWVHKTIDRPTARSLPVKWCQKHWVPHMVEIIIIADTFREMDYCNCLYIHAVTQNNQCRHKRGVTVHEEEEKLTTER
jgi:hypothetical protein